MNWIPLVHHAQMTHTCGSKLCHHWFITWIVIYLTLSHFSHNTGILLINPTNPFGITFDEVWIKKIPIHGNEFVSNICKMTPTLSRFTCWVLVCSDIYHLYVQMTMPEHDPHLSARKNNYIHYKVWDEITYPFPTFKSAVIAVWEWVISYHPL